MHSLTLPPQEPSEHLPPSLQPPARRVTDLADSGERLSPEIPSDEENLRNGKPILPMNFIQLRDPQDLRPPFKDYPDKEL